MVTDHDDNDFDVADDQTAVPCEEAPAQSETAADAPARGVTGAIRKTSHIVRTAREQSPQKFLFVSVAAVVAMVILVIIMVAVVGRSSADQPRPQRPDFTSNVGIDQDSSSRVQAFIRAQERHGAELERELERTRQEFASQRHAQERLIRELSEGRQRAQQEAAEARRRLEEATALLQEAASRQVPVLIAGQESGAVPVQQGYADFIQGLRQQHAAGNLTAVDARMRLRRRLIDQEGYDPAEVERVIDTILERLGVLFVGDVAEPPPSAEEIAQLSGRLPDLFAEVQQYSFQKGSFEGQVLPRMADIKRMVHLRFGPEAYTDEQIAQLAMLARVRLENVTPTQEEQLGRLVAERERRSIARDDLLAIESLIWSQRERLPGMTPGQHLALIGAVSRSRGAPGSPQEDRSLRAATPDDIEVATIRVRRAIDQAVAQGIRDQSGVLTRARWALERFLSDGRIQMASTQRDSIVLVAVQEALQASTGSGPQPSPPTRGDQHGTWRPQDQRRDDTPVQPADPRQPAQLQLGHLVVPESLVGYTTWLMVPSIASGLGLDPDTAQGAAGIVTMWSQAAHIGEKAFAVHGEDQQGTQRWYETVVRQLVEAGLDGVTFANNDLTLPGAPEEQHHWLTSIVVAERVAGQMADHDQALAAYQILEQSVADRSPVTPQVQHVLSQSARLKPWMRLAVVRKALSPDVVPLSAGRSANIINVVLDEVSGRREALQAVINSDTDDTMQAVADQVRETFQLMMPMVVAMSIASADRGSIAIDALQEQVRIDTAQYATMVAAEARIMQTVVTRMLRPYVAQISADGGGIPAVLSALRTQVPSLLLDQWARQRPSPDDDDIVPLAVSMSETLLPEVERLLVRVVVLTNVEPRVRRSGRAFDHQVVEEALSGIAQRADDVVMAPYTVQRINAWIMELQEFGMDVLAGRSGVGPGRPAGRRPQAPDDAAPGPRMAFPAVVPARVSGQPLGVREERLQGRQVVLNAGTYANAYLTTGVSAEVGGTGNIPVLLEMPVTFHGPGGGLVHMPAVRFIGQANPRAGSERLSVQLVRMSYRFPNGRAIDKEVNGFVADAVDGVEGAIGQFRLNADKVLPAAVAAGFLQGAGQALNQNATTVEVTAGGTTTVSETGSTLQRALLGGSSEGATIIGDYIRQYMDDVRPTVSAPNGQPVTVILLDPVVFDDVSDEEWASLQVDTAQHGF